MKRKQIDEFETLQGQLQAFHEEMGALVKKSPNDALNKFKLGLVNSVLKKSNTLLGKNRLPFADFELFDEAALPSTSDVLVMISQYLSAFEKLRTENIRAGIGGWFWFIEDEPENEKWHENCPSQESLRLISDSARVHALALTSGSLFKELVQLFSRAHLQRPFRGEAKQRREREGDANLFLDRMAEIDVCLARCVDEPALLPVK